MKQWWRNQVKRWERERWRDREFAGKGPVVSTVEISKPRRGEGPFLIVAWGYQPAPPGERGLRCQPWGKLPVDVHRWQRDAKSLVESVFSVRSREALFSVDCGRFVATQEVYGRGFFDRNMVVSVSWDEPNAVEIHPLKGADRSAVGVWELGRSVALEQKEGRVRLQISTADFVAMIDELLRFSEVVTTNKLKKALALLAEQGVELREQPEE